jgi:tRNA(fMet)-specific endonuclease VapC
VICLDTDTASAVLRHGGGPAGLARRLGTVDPAAHFTTAITVGELLYGARRRRSRRLQSEIEKLLGRDIRVLSFDEPAARVYAEIRVELESGGRPLADPDLRIAAICLLHDLTLVTGNTKHFERVPELRVENWLE